MTIRIQADTDTEGVRHHWYPDRGFGTLDFGRNGHMNHLYFHDTADVDSVIAELVALRVEMVPSPASPEAVAALAGSIRAGTPLLVTDDGHLCWCGHLDADHHFNGIADKYTDCNACDIGTCDAFRAPASVTA